MSPHLRHRALLATILVFFIGFILATIQEQDTSSQLKNAYVQFLDLDRNFRYKGTFGFLVLEYLYYLFVLFFLVFKSAFY